MSEIIIINQDVNAKLALTWYYRNGLDNFPIVPEITNDMTEDEKIELSLTTPVISGENRNKYKKACKLPANIVSSIMDTKSNLFGRFIISLYEPEKNYYITLCLNQTLRQALASYSESGDIYCPAIYRKWESDESPFSVHLIDIYKGCMRRIKNKYKTIIMRENTQRRTNIRLGTTYSDHISEEIDMKLGLSDDEQFKAKMIEYESLIAGSYPLNYIIKINSKYVDAITWKPNDIDVFCPNYKLFQWYVENHKVKSIAASKFISSFVSIKVQIEDQDIEEINFIVILCALEDLKLMADEEILARLNDINHDSGLSIEDVRKQIISDFDLDICTVNYDGRYVKYHPNFLDMKGVVSKSFIKHSKVYERIKKYKSRGFDISWYYDSEEWTDKVLLSD